MKHIVFLTINDISSIDVSDIYTDMLFGFINKDYKVSIISPTAKENPHFIKISDNLRIIKPKIINYKTKNLIKKGFSLLTLDHFYKKSIVKYFSKESIDLILYATPPMNLYKTIKYLKKKTRAKTYLLLKDIFPQNAIDLEMIKKNGFIYKYFKMKEHNIYKISDKIGCMSEKNKEYILEHNRYLTPEKVEVNPNSMDISRNIVTIDSIETIRKKYGIPTNKIIYVYGGNLGRPQGIDFLEKR